MRGAIAVGIFLFVSCNMARGEVYAPPVDVELLVRGLDAKPLANTEIELKHVPFSSRGPKPPSASAKTDAQGVARFKFPGGDYDSLHVEAKGVGYADIGISKFAWGETARPYLPPLAPYCTIEGTLPKEALKEDTLALGFHSHFEQRLEMKPDADGRFKFTNARAGQWYIGAGFDKRRDADTMIVIAPGQTVRNVNPKFRPATVAEQEKRELYPPKGEQLRWFVGTVRDEVGKPISDATVFAVGMEDSGFGRGQPITLKSETDKQGHYEISGPSGLSGFSGLKMTLLTIVPGRPAVWSWPNFPRVAGMWVPVGTIPKPGEFPLPVQEDIVVPPKGGDLQVTVLENGNAQPGMFVSAWLENTNLPRQRENGELQKSIDQSAFPIKQTNENGVAFFENLPPGRYQLTAQTKEARGRPDSWFPEKESPFAVAESVAVRPGETTSFKMAAHSLPFHGRARFLNHAGTPLKSDDSSGLVHSGEPIRPRNDINYNRGHLRLSNFPGLWEVSSKYPHPQKRFTNITEPYFMTSGIVATSHCLKTDFVPQFAARWIEPASARVIVLDIHGKPLRAVVELGIWYDDAYFSGSTDEQGQIYFAGLGARNGGYMLVSATVPGQVPFDVLSRYSRRPEDAPLPQDQELQNRLEIFTQPLALALNEAARMTLRQEAVGYVKGKIELDANTQLMNIGLIIDPALNQPSAQIYVRKSSGEFLAGPFRDGPVRLTVLHKNDQGGELRATVSTNVCGGEVTHLNITPPPAPKGAEQTLSVAGTPTSRNSFFGSDAEMAARKVLDGQVFFSDGKTPAWGAQVLYFLPGDNEPKIERTTDALGNFRPRSPWYMNLPEKGAGPKGPAEPVVVAFLPGTCGGAVLPPPQRSDMPLRVVLPPSITQRGRVTVGGQTPAKMNGVIRVKAAYQDKGFLNELLSVETSADVDGNFTLAGLTPGNYIVQAALDEIWLSPSTKLRVEADTLKPVELSIPSPGAPIVVKLVDSKGQPRIGEKLTIDRPAGPLTDMLWPREWISDGLGVVNIPTLEAGKHALRAANAAEPVSVTAPAVPAKDAVQVRIQVKEPEREPRDTFHYTPRETLPEIPDRPANDALRGSVDSIRQLVLKAIPIGTRYNVVRDNAEREGWEDISYQSKKHRISGPNLTFSLGNYKEGGKKITAVAIIELKQAADNLLYSTEVRIEKADDVDD